MEVGIGVDGFVFFFVWVMRFLVFVGWFGVFRIVFLDMFLFRVRGELEIFGEIGIWFCLWVFFVKLIK